MPGSAQLLIASNEELVKRPEERRQPVPRWRAPWTALAAAALLIACGGGGGEGNMAAAPAATTFPLQSAYQRWVQAGGTTNFAVSGSCAGTARVVAGTPSNTTFEGATALATTVVQTATLVNCPSSSLASNVTLYYSPAYVPVGLASSGAYGVVASSSALPASVKVGDTGIFATETLYASSAKTTVTGRLEISYVIEPESASTAVVDIVQKRSDPSNVLQETVQTRYRLYGDGTTQLVSMDVQSAAVPSFHLVLNVQ